MSVYGWRGAKRKAIEARLELEEEMRSHQGNWDVSPCMPPAVYFDAEANAWVAASQDPATGQLNTKVFRVAEMPGGAAAARSAAIEARLEMDDDEEGEQDPDAVPMEAPLTELPTGMGGEESELACRDVSLGLLQSSITGGVENKSHVTLQECQQAETSDTLQSNTGEETPQLNRQPMGTFDQQQDAPSFLADVSSTDYTPAVVAKEGRLKAKKRRKTLAQALAASAVPGGSRGPKNRRHRSEMGSYREDRETTHDGPAPVSLPSSRFSATTDNAVAVAELLGETAKATDPNRSVGDQDTTITFSCPVSTIGVAAASAAVPGTEGLDQSDSVAAHLAEGVCINNQAATMQMQQLSSLLAPDQLEHQRQQQQQKPYCCAQHLEMLQQMDEIQRQLPEVALCRQNMYGRLLAAPEQPATPEQLRELQSARADFEELSQQQLRMEQQLQLLNQQQHHHALQHRAEVLQQQGLAQHNVAQQSQELLQQQGLLREHDLLQQRVLQQRMLQQRVLQQQLMQQQQFIQQQQLLQQQHLQPQQLLQQQRIPGGDSFSQLGGMTATGATSQGAVATNNTEHEQQQQQPYFRQPTF